MKAGVVAAATVVLVVLAGCATTAPLHPRPTNDAPWKESADVVDVTAAPDAGGVLSFRNCPTLEEARAAIPAITAGPDANAVPFKSMVLQCGYELPGRDLAGRPAGVAVLVFDAAYEGRETFEWTLDAGMGSPAPIADLGERAFATGGRGETEVWVEAGRWGLHVLPPLEGALTVEELAALARATLIALDRPPR